MAPASIDASVPQEKPAFEPCPKNRQFPPFFFLSPFPVVFRPVYSAPMCSPFSATERFMSKTRGTRPKRQDAKSQKSSK